jgi:sterol 3beta-glucosyltransferase
VTILIVGSRGDVQPFIALALSLAKVGHRVRIATHEAHREFVSDWNIDFFPLAGDPRELMKLCVENDMFTISFMREGYAHYMSFIEELLMSTWNACKDDTDVIIQNPPAMGGPHIAEKLKVRRMLHYANTNLLA